MSDRGRNAIGPVEAGPALGVIVAAVSVVSGGWNTDFSAPPRYDGAGYAVLGLALAEGHGYRREIHAPVPVRHTQFPRGYLLAFTEAGQFLIPLVPRLIVGALEGLSALAVRAWLRRPRAWAAWVVLALSRPYPIYSVVS